MNVLDAILHWLRQILLDVSMTRQAFGVVIVAAAIGLYGLVHLYLSGRLERMRERVAAFRPGGSRRATLDDQLAAIQWWHERLGAILIASPAIGRSERTRLAKILADAGLRRPGAIATLATGKLFGAIFVGCAGWVLVEWRHPLFTSQAAMFIAALMGAALLGWRLPDLAVAIIARRRRERIEDAMPDALDLLVICVEAGLSLEQAINFVAREAEAAFPDLGKEFEITAGELQVLGDRSEALRKLAQRLDLPSVRSIVATLIQTIKYGTPLTDSLRVLAAEMRTARLLRIEERAARLPVVLTLPLILFILPCTFMVIGGPAGLQVIDAFKPMHVGAPPK